MSQNTRRLSDYSWHRPSEVRKLGSGDADSHPAWLPTAPAPKCAPGASHLLTTRLSPSPIWSQTHKKHKTPSHIVGLFPWSYLSTHTGSTPGSTGASFPLWCSSPCPTCWTFPTPWNTTPPWSCCYPWDGDDHYFWPHPQDRGRSYQYILDQHTFLWPWPWPSSEVWGLFANKASVPSPSTWRKLPFLPGFWSRRKAGGKARRNFNLATHWTGRY